MQKENEIRNCKHHGSVTHIWIEKSATRGFWRCLKCRTQYTITSKRKQKQQLVIDAGGKCVKCGYDKCLAALHFHHLDPTQKSFGIAAQSISLSRARNEIAKCILVCANCHAELEAGV